MIRTFFEHLKTSRMTQFWLVLAIAHMVYAMCISPRIYYAEDDVLYQIMAKSAAEYKSLFIENGYTDFHSGLFKYHHFYAPAPGEEKLAAQYPPLFPLLASPFFTLFGTEGPYLLNALLFLGATWLTYKIALNAFGNRSIAHGAAIIFAAAGFAWSISLAALSHTLAMTLILASYYFAQDAIYHSRRRDEEWLAGVNSGLLLGFAVMTRIDSFFAIVGLAAICGFAKPVRWRAGIGILGGMLFPLYLLYRINLLKFGHDTPFSYGEQGISIFRYQSYLPQAAITALLMGGGFLWYMISPERRSGNNGLALLAVTFLGVALITLFFHPVVLDSIAYIGWQSGTPLNERGIYEKSVLQNAPYLTVCVAGLWLALKAGERGLRLALLLVTPLLYILIFVVNGNPSFVHFYQRFLSPAMPFFAIVVAYTIHGLLRPSFKIIAAVAAAVYFAVWVVCRFWWSDILALPYFRMQMYFPHFLTVLLLVLSGVIWLRGKSGGSLIPRITGMVALVSVCFSSAVVFVADTPALPPLQEPFRRGLAVAPYIKPNALLLITRDQLRLLPSFLDVPGIRMAMPISWMMPDPPKDEVERMVEFFAAHGHPIYSYLTQASDVPDRLKAIGYTAINPTPDPAFIKWEKP